MEEYFFLNPICNSFWKSSLQNDGGDLKQIGFSSYCVEIWFILCWAIRLLHVSKTDLPICLIWFRWHVLRSECLSDLRLCQCSLAFRIVLSLSVMWLILSDQLLSPENDPISILNGHYGLLHWLLVGIVQSNGLVVFSTNSTYVVDCWIQFFHWLYL